MKESDNDDKMSVGNGSNDNLDCYPYTFTPLLLFAEENYFDKGHSNYNAVSQFFAPVVPVNMLENVLYERKNMLYEELLDHVTKHQMLVTCCIDAHFTAFQIVTDPKKKRPALVYYDPLQQSLQLVSGDHYKRFALFFLLKCNYADSQHIQENKDYYTGLAANPVKNTIYSLWKKINTTAPEDVVYATKSIYLNTTEYFLINDRRRPACMSTQLTGNTCYFQTYLFAVLCKVGQLSLGGSTVDVTNLEALQKTTVDLSCFMLEFFVNESAMRPLTNSNVVIDFYRYQRAPYYQFFVRYLKQVGQPVPDYEKQYEHLMRYFHSHPCLHTYGKFTLEGAMASTPNTKSLQDVPATEGAAHKLARSDYYKYRAANCMFGCNANILAQVTSFCEFNALRKNQLLRFYSDLKEHIGGCAQALSKARRAASKYRDYYFMPQFEVGQQELIDVHHYTFLIDLISLCDGTPELVDRVTAVNDFLVDSLYFSTQKSNSYHKMMSIPEFKKSKKHFRFFRNTFMSSLYHTEFIGLGFAEINPKEKEINSLTQTVFYTTELMRSMANRQSYEFEKECINQMARSNLRRCLNRFDEQDMQQKYKVTVKIGHGYTYSKYNTLMHFLGVVESYWHNPDLSNVQVFGKDIRVLLAVSCQKIFFEKGHSGFYHYGPMECHASYRSDLDLAVGTSIGSATPSVSKKKRKDLNELIITDRVFEFQYMKNIVEGIFERANGEAIRSDNEVLQLCLLSLMLDFGLYNEYIGLLHLPVLQCLQHAADTRELQVEVANRIYEFDRKNTSDSITRRLVEDLIFECSYKFLVNKDFSLQSRQFKLIRMLNADPDYQSYVMLCKIYMSLCQINKSVEVDYYKVHCDSEFRIIIPRNYSKTTSDYLDMVTTRYTFSERGGVMMYDDLEVFDLRPQQPEINLYKVRFDSGTFVQSMVKYIEVTNAFRVAGSREQYLLFMADNVLLVEAADSDRMVIRINKIEVEVATAFFNDAISFVPCLKYSEGQDVVFFCSPNLNYMIDKGGQFATDYYGMKHELIECISSDEVFVDLNDEHVFKQYKLSELLTESKTVIYFPDYLLQVPNRQELINLLDLAIKVRNVSFFILVLFYLRRSSVFLEFIEREDNTIKITGPWKDAILYVLGRAPSNLHYDSIFKQQFFDLDQYQDMPIDDFIDVLCANFTKYQRFTADGEYQIIPRPKQKAFLKHIISAEEPFHFSEVGSGKTKVILPLLCQAFLSNNSEVHAHFAKGGTRKDTLVVLVPEHLVSDARSQVFRYCLNLNFQKDYRVYDDIFALLHKGVKLDGKMKRIFVTSFNQFKKALTYDAICAKVHPCREQILVVADEVDDFLDRNKLVFNVCSNKNNSFDRPTLDLYYDVSRAAYERTGCPDVSSSSNPEYWSQLYEKFSAIISEIQDASRSINKSFGIFNALTLQHCSGNIVQDIEGYKSLIARPYESVNRAMPGSYFSDVERTIVLTFVILVEDAGKYDELFQAERKFISFEYWNTHFTHQLDYDDLCYGHEKLSEIVERHPATKDGLTRFLYEIILRRMEIRDNSRSVNSVDVVFNFNCIGFTGTPFLDNYPTFDYIRAGRKDDIPDMIDRSFYAYTSDDISSEEFEDRFTRFQGQNSHVQVEYVPSDFIRESPSEQMTLRAIFECEQRSVVDSGEVPCFNALVDLCGIFKQSTIHDVRELIKQHFGDKFLFLYHIDQVDNSDRVLSINSDNDVQYDQEFYRYLCKTYGADLRDRIFFFVDNRNVIGKDVPFQLAYQRDYGLPLFSKSVVLAHDVDDFSKIWQAMGRSRTMNDTLFSIYKSGIPEGVLKKDSGLGDIKKQEFTRMLYVHNCDCKIAGNISSIYLTLIALFNLSKRSFYYRDTIVNTFLEKMEMTLPGKVKSKADELAMSVLGDIVPARILMHILKGKFRRSANPVVSREEITEPKVETLLRLIVKQKFEQRVLSGDVYDDLLVYLSGEQKIQMEISYTKQQQKQKQTQKNKNQDSDAMGLFDKKNRLTLSFGANDYYDLTLTPSEDLAKVSLNLLADEPIISVAYNGDKGRKIINVYPTLQFLYSHHIRGEYLTEEVKSTFRGFNGIDPYFERFLSIVSKKRKSVVTASNGGFDMGDLAIEELDIEVLTNFVRQNPLYSMAALEEGVYLIGMKDQFNSMDMQSYPLQSNIKYISDEMGFILFDRTNSKSVDSFGPYSIEQYILMEVLSKQEVAQNVLDYYCNHKDVLERGLESYDEKQGKGFICWRFLVNEAMRRGDEESSSSKRSSPQVPSEIVSTTESKRQRSGTTEKGAMDAVADGLARSLDI